MRNLKFKLVSFALIFALCLSFSACNPVDDDYGVKSEVSTDFDNTLDTVEHDDTPIMSSDRVMSKYFDISLFDEENYADIYLGKKFEINGVLNGEKLEVPTKLSNLKKKGWKLNDGNAYDENSLVFAYETIEETIINEKGIVLTVWFYNSSRSSKTLSECNIVKYLINNDFYKDNQNYNEFNVSGITNSMAITDVIDTLGTPSHFYKVSDNSYYLDYFATKKDRRNGITVYINPLEDSITSIEFSYYK